jgi:hypothetical protein
MKDDRDTTFAYGCDEYWTKPILDFPEFQRAIGEMLRKGRQNVSKSHTMTGRGASGRMAEFRSRNNGAQ